MRHLFVLGIMMSLGGVVACSDVVEEGGATQSNEVQGGKRDTKQRHNFAVGIANKVGSVCSGTLIAPNLVLTARHCVVAPEAKKAVTCDDAFGANTSASNLLVTTEPEIRGAEKLYKVVEIITPQSKAFCGNDIALVRLAENIPATEAEPAIPVVNFSIADEMLSGQVTALGYGNTAPNAGDPGTRRIREDIDVICVPGEDRFDCSQTVYSTVIDRRAEFITQGYVCSGDSGGGAFDQASFATVSEGGRPYVLGALSRGPMSETECLAAIYSRTDAHRDLIVNAGKKAAQLGSYEAADWVKGIVPVAAKKAAPAAAPAGEDGCEDDICTETSATEPTSAATSQPIIASQTGCSSTGTSSSNAATTGLLLAATILATRRRRSR